MVAKKLKEDAQGKTTKGSHNQEPKREAVYVSFISLNGGQGSTFIVDG